jgi:hypothetical protein
LLLKIKQDKAKLRNSLWSGGKTRKGRVGEEYYHIDERREVLVCLLWQAHQ